MILGDFKDYLHPVIDFPAIRMIATNRCINAPQLILILVDYNYK